MSTESEIQLNIKGPSELKLQISIATDKTVIDLKRAIAEKSDVTADRQRLIYSGRVLKDDDQLSVYKIQSGHTVHMVKGQSRQQASSSSPTPQQIPNMQAGQNIHDPLTQLNSHLGFGAMAGVNPFADLGLNPNDPNMMTSMMNDPRVLEQMATAMSNPAVIDQVIAMNPQLAAMGPRIRQMFQSEEFRRIMSNPEQLQGMMRMASLMRETQGGSPMFNPFAPPPSFPAPGVPGQPASTTSTNNPTSASNPTNPSSPRAGGFGSPPPPADTRSPEERFQVQLQQLQEMGFTNATQNVRALMATGGNVHSAIEYILNGGGL
ncbi:Ubiquitin domain-containing protein DSK2 [Leucoagaricus sp. SymC.cos]|nr:Ubiquitin domain-containing protein DSK2 [Leucoagaricus sp. SymC.cos]